MKLKANKWPKLFPPLTEGQRVISDDFMKSWHEELARSTRYNLLEKFNHSYPVKYAPCDFSNTLEIGAGLGTHLNYEKLTQTQKKNYVALELRECMANQIKVHCPDITALVGDIQTTLPFPDGHFDRILAIHVLEHLPNLPVAIKEMHRLCNKQVGQLSIVIPCEGGLLHDLARQFAGKRFFEQRYKQSYQWFIQREHINKPNEIFDELSPYFHMKHRTFFPLLFPSVHTNLCLGITMCPKK